jgi:hypothetical protein
MTKKIINNQLPICSVEKTHRHFDRSVPKGREAEKSIQKQISRLACGSLEMTSSTLFYGALPIINRKGVALLVVLFIVMVITVLSLGYLSRSDVELACGENMLLRTQMDYLAESGLEHARGLIPSNNDFLGNWEAIGQQLVESSDDYYDISVTKLGQYNYQITSHAYREKDGEKIGQSTIRAQLRLDPCIAYWTSNDTIISNTTVINGDVYCGGNLTNNGTVNGDIFAAGLSGSGTKSGQLYGTDKAVGVVNPGLNISNFITPTPPYVPDSNGNVELIGQNLTVNGIVVDCNLVINGGTIKITAVKNSPALLVGNKLTLKNGAVLEVNGFAQTANGLSVDNGTEAKISGALFIIGTGGISGNGNVVITAEPAKASFQLPPAPDGKQKRWSPAGGAFFRSVKRE